MAKSAEYVNKRLLLDAKQINFALVRNLEFILDRNLFILQWNEIKGHRKGSW